MKTLSLFAATLLASATCASASTLLFDDFDNNDLATGGTNGGFRLVSNSSNGTGIVAESGGNATIATAADSFDNSGIVSINSFDTSSLSGFTTTFVVSSQTTYASTNNTELLIQGGTSNGTGDGSGFRATNNLIFKINSSGVWSLTGNDGSGVTLFTGSSVGAGAEVANGYSVTMNVNAAGWQVTSSDLGTNINQSGAWSGGFDYTDLQSSTLYTAAMIQANGSNTSRSLNLDSISVVAIPEPSSSSLLLLGGSALLLRRKRR